MSDLSTDVQTLESILNSSNPDLSHGNTAITSIKKKLILKEYFSNPQKNFSETSSLSQVRDALEVICLFNIRTSQLEAFNRHYAMLRPLYFSKQTTSLPPSSKRMGIIYLYLLSCLAQTPPALANFFTEYELLSLEDRGHEYITEALKIEQTMENGTFAATNQSLPLPEYSHIFSSQFISSVRQATIAAIEASYTSIPLKKLAVLLNLADNNSQLHQIIQEHNWAVEQDKVIFPRLNTSASPVDINHQTLDSFIKIAEYDRKIGY